MNGVVSSHIAGIPVEEALLFVLPVGGLVGALVVAKLRALVGAAARSIAPRRHPLLPGERQPSDG